MKKLTAGILTVLLGIVSANSADAAVASKGYVDSVAAAEAAAAQQAAEDTAAGALSTAKSELEDKIDAKVAQADYDAKVQELNTAISNEATARAGADDGLQEQINAIKNLTGTEGVAQQIANAVNTEKAAREAADSAINDVIGSGFSKDSTIATQLSAVKTTADSAVQFDDVATADKAGIVQLASQYSDNDTTKAVTGAVVAAAISNYSSDMNTVINDITATASAADTLSKSNKDEIDAINNVNTGILKQAQDYADQAELDAIDAAKTETQNKIAALALKAISQVPAECSAMDKYCALTYGTDGYVWEVIERATDEVVGADGRTVTSIKPTRGN